MKTILIASQKGGSGKTTLVAHLAVEAQKTSKKPVWVIDTDKQGTLTQWHGRRKEETPILGSVSLSTIKQGLEKISTNSSYCFIDSAPTISSEVEQLIRLVDLVVIPVRPSPADLWSVGETVRLVQQQKKKFIFVLTQAKLTATITAQATAALSKFGRVAESFIGDRIIYASSMTSGNVAGEISKGTAASEVEALWKELKGV